MQIVEPQPTLEQELQDIIMDGDMQLWEEESGGGRGMHPLRCGMTCPQLRQDVHGLQSQSVRHRVHNTANMDVRTPRETMRRRQRR